MVLEVRDIAFNDVERNFVVTSNSPFQAELRVTFEDVDLSVTMGVAWTPTNW